MVTSLPIIKRIEYDVKPTEEISTIFLPIIRGVIELLLARLKFAIYSIIPFLR